MELWFYMSFIQISTELEKLLISLRNGTTLFNLNLLSQINPDDDGPGHNAAALPTNIQEGKGAAAASNDSFESTVETSEEAPQV